MNQKNESENTTDEHGIWRWLRALFSKSGPSTGIQPDLRPGAVGERDETPQERYARYRDEARCRFMGRGFY